MVGTTGVALATVALMGTTPVTTTGVTLLANSAVYYLQGTKIGDTTSHPAPFVFTTAMMTGAGRTPPQAGDFHFVDYPATIGPFSNGGFRDPSWGVSVGRGIAALGEQPQPGDTVFGFSQGAVVATAYKREHLANGVNYVLVENPGRPNGGIFERFHGLYIPLLNVKFDGATPVVRDPQEGSGSTVDIARQYDGWADFPKYPLNLLATANAVLGIVYLHGDTQDLDESAVADIDKTDPRYYQQHGDTTYYLIPTKRLPLLMPLDGLIPDAVLDRLDVPLRALIETGYDRSDYSKDTPAQLVPPIGAPAAPHPDSAAASTAEPLARPAVSAASADEPAARSARTAVTADPGPADAPAAKGSDTAQTGAAATAQTPKPPRPSLTTQLRQSAAAISSTLRSLTGRTPRPEAGDTEPAAVTTSSQPKTADAGKPATKTADNGTDKADAA